MHGDTPDAGRLGGYLNDAQQVPRHFPLKKRADTEQPITLYPGLWTGRPVRAGVDDGRQHGRHIRPTSWTTRSRLRASRRTGRVAAVRPRRPRGCMTGYMAGMTV